MLVKILLFICSLCIIGCETSSLIKGTFKPTLVVGDCVVSLNDETWEQKAIIYKILEIGKRSYKARMFKYNTWYPLSHWVTIYFNEPVQKTICPGGNNEF